VTTDPVLVLEDRDEIHDVMMRYAHGVDQREMEMVRACFAPDVKTVGWGPGDGFDRDGLIGFISGVGHFRETMHMMGNQLIEVDGDRAAMDTFAMLTHRLDGDANKLLVNSSYVEKLARRDGAWVIVQRGGEPAWAPRGVDELASDDPAVQWLLDRAAIRDALVRHTVALVNDEHRREFLGTRLITLEGDEAFAESYAILTPLTAGEERSRPPEVATPAHQTDHFVRTPSGWHFADRELDGPGRFRSLPVPPPSDDPRVRALVDRAQIADVVVASAYALDRRDERLLRACESTGIVVHTASGADIVGIDAQLANLHGEMWAADASWLFLNNQLVDMDPDGDGASVQTYVYWVERLAAGAEPTSWTNGAVRFLDRVQRDGDRWVLVERTVANNVMPDDKVMTRPPGEQGIDAMTRRAEARAREWQQASHNEREQEES
jgi:hypothetical protein